MPDGNSETAPAIASIADLSAACVRFVATAVGVTLDFTPETLPVLDHYLRELDSQREEFMQLIAPAAGAYLGEVVRAHLGPCRWYLEGDGPEAIRLEFERCFLSFNPVGAAVEAILRAEAPGYGAHLHVLPGDGARVRESLDRTGDVRSEDYYRLAIRYEVLEQVATLLTAGREEGESASLGPDVYAALRDQPGKPAPN